MSFNPKKTQKHTFSVIFFKKKNSIFSLSTLKRSMKIFPDYIYKMVFLKTFQYDIKKKVPFAIITSYIYIILYKKKSEIIT